MEPAHNKQTFYSLHHKEFLFLFLFSLYFITGQALFHVSRPYIKPLLTNILTAKVASYIINIITPHEQSSAREAVIGSGGHAIDISEGCEGIEGIILISAAILAFYAGFKQKIAGIVAGTIFIYICNLCRIIMLYYIHKHEPELFDIFHIFVGQTFIIFAGILFFVIWINKFAGSDGKTL
ncbi:MAG: archaeosortase/exosortase family protein [Candidatus Latescibacteria bacterium]|nr:archaeosortase/exosortase family protein [Candidatus Latescibacterota bacterium]